MKTKYLISLWVALLLTALLSRAVYATYWLDELNQFVLLVSAAASLALGVAILIEKKFSFYSIFLVSLSLVIGQWWLIETLLARVIWSINGFAP